MAWSSKVFVLLVTVIVSLTTTPGQCQQSRTNTSSSTSSVVTTLSIIGGIIGFVAVIVPVCVFVCYRASKAKEQRRRDFYAATPSQTQAVYSSYTTAAQQQAPPTVMYNASYTHYHNGGGTNVGSRVLYSIDDQDSDPRASAPQNTRTADVHHNDKQVPSSMNLSEATLQGGVEPPTYQEALNIETPSTQQTLEADNQPPPYSLDSTDTIN